MVNDLTKTRREKFAPTLCSEVHGGDEEDYVPKSAREYKAGDCSDPNLWSPEEQEKLRIAVLQMEEERAKEERKDKINKLEKELKSISTRFTVNPYLFGALIGIGPSVIHYANTLKSQESLLMGIYSGITAGILAKAHNYLMKERPTKKCEKTLDSLYAKDHPSAMFEEQPGA